MTGLPSVARGFAQFTRAATNPASGDPAILAGGLRPSLLPITSEDPPMARRGRKPNPENLRILKGLPGRAPIVAGRPEMPEHLDDVARAEWAKMIPILEDLGVLSVDSGPALAQYCAAFSRWREASTMIQAEGIVIPTARGGRVAHPATRVARDASNTMLNILSEFGCTPASRRGANVEPRHEPDALDEFLANRPRQRGPGAS